MVMTGSAKAAGNRREPPAPPHPEPAASSPEPAPPSLTRSSERWILGVVTLTNLTVVLSSTALAIALSAIAGHFGAGPVSSTWMVAAPQLVVTCLLVTFGRLADIFGRRALFVLGLAVFSLGAGLAGLAPNVGVLIGLQVVQAMGAAMLLANTGAIVASVFTGPRLHGAMGIYLASVSIGQMVGPIVGGSVAEFLGWRAVFWVQVPLALVCLVLGAVHLRALPAREGADRSVDYLGAVVLAGALVGLLLAISAVQSWGPFTWRVAGGLAVALLLFLVLVPVERRARVPVVPLRLFRHREFTVANIASLLSVMPRFTLVTLLALWFQAAAGDTALQAGLKLVPLAVGVAVGSVGADALGRTWGVLQRSTVVPNLVMVLGLVPLGLGLRAGVDHWALAVALFVVGFGGGLFTTVNASAIIGAAPVADVGSVNGIRLTILNIGIALSTVSGLAVATSALPVGQRTDFYSATLSGDSALQLLRTGFDRVVLVMVALALLSALLTALTARRRGGDNRGA